MKSIIVNGICFGVGLAAGIVGTMTYFKNKYSKIADEQISEMAEYYQHRDEYDRESSNLAEDEAEINPVSENNTDRSKGVLSKEARDEIKAKLTRNYEQTTNYASIYKEKHPDLFKQAEEMADAEGDIQQPNEAEIANIEHEKHKFDPPKIISDDEYDNLPPNIDTQTLYFHMYDETLVDDNDEIIDNPSVLIGDALNVSDFIDNDETMLFVLNPGIDTAYEIQKVYGSYDE